MSCEPICFDKSEDYAFKSPFYLFDYVVFRSLVKGGRRNPEIRLIRSLFFLHLVQNIRMGITNAEASLKSLLAVVPSKGLKG